MTNMVYGTAYSTCEVTAVFPYRCADGSCVSDLASCRISAFCPAPYHRCDDGLCVLSRTECPVRFPTLHLADHYSHHAPFLQFLQTEAIARFIQTHFQFDTTVAYRSCLRKISIRQTLCPHDRPFRCASGVCVTKASLCPTIVPCSPRYVGNGLIRCPDGQCVPDSKMCNSTSPCPSEAPVLCVGGRSDGQCVAAADLCLLENGCPAGLPYRCMNGFCNENAEACDDISLPNGCARVTPYKCIDGSCKQSPTDCLLHHGCPLDTPFRTRHGVCVSTPSADPLLDTYYRESSCPSDTPVLCSNGECVTSPVFCLPSSNCYLLHSRQCSNGECGSWPHQYPFIDFLPKVAGTDTVVVTAEVENRVQNKMCNPTPRCPPDMPLMCANMECVADYANCRPYIGYEVRIDGWMDGLMD